MGIVTHIAPPVSATNSASAVFIKEKETENRSCPDIPAGDPDETDHDRLIEASKTIIAWIDKHYKKIMSKSNEADLSRFFETIKTLQKKNYPLIVVCFRKWAYGLPTSDSNRIRMKNFYLELYKEQEHLKKDIDRYSAILSNGKTVSKERAREIAFNSERTKIRRHAEERKTGIIMRGGGFIIVIFLLFMHEHRDIYWWLYWPLFIIAGFMLFVGDSMKR